MSGRKRLKQQNAAYTRCHTITQTQTKSLTNRVNKLNTTMHFYFIKMKTDTLI